MTTTNVEKELVQLENRYWQALKDRDSAEAMRLTDDPCIVTGPQGVSRIGRDALGDMMRDAPYTLESFELKPDVQVLMVTDDLAIVAYEVSEDFTVDGKPVHLDAAQSSTWVRRDGQWRCAAHAESLTGDPFGRDRQPAAEPKS